MTDRYVLVTRDDRAPTLHRNPREVCNTDDAARKETVDPITAQAMKAGGTARLCNHCYEEEPVT